jgi:hypothetical protein
MTKNLPTVADIKSRLDALIEDMKALEASSITDAELVPLVKSAQSVKAYIDTLDAQIRFRAVSNGIAIPGVAVKPGITHRKWHDEDVAGDLAYSQFGLKAFKLLSPAAIEKLGDEGKALVAVASFKPEAEDRVVY